MRGSGPDELADSHVLAAVRRGDRGAFAVIVNRHRQAVFAYLRARMLEPADAEDLCQEVFLRGYTLADRFDGDGTARPWLLGIARNVLREHLRTLSRRKEVLWAEMCLEIEARSPQSAGLYDDVAGYLPDCIGALGPSARKSLEMRYRSQLRHAEIAERLRRSADAVKLLLYRARQALRRCLEGRVRQAEMESAARRASQRENSNSTIRNPQSTISPTPESRILNPDS